MPPPLVAQACAVDRHTPAALSLVYPPLIEFDKSLIRRLPGGASNDLLPNLQNPSNPVLAMDPLNPPKIGA